VELLIGLLGCAKPGHVEGTVRDARTDTPLSVDVTLTPDAPSEACPALTLHPGDDGGFAGEICGNTRYTADIGDPGWRLDAPVPVTGSVDLRPWRVPDADGVYTLTGTELTWIATNTALDTARVMDSDATVRLPVEIPGSLPRIVGDTLLLLAGDVADLAFSPLIPSDKRWFGSRDAPESIDPWVYLGVRFSSDTAFERVDASPTGATDRTVAGRRLRMYDGHALPAGRYALAAPDAARAIVLEFGDAVAMP
jgi:hypothetical protein